MDKSEQSGEDERSDRGIVEELRQETADPVTETSWYRNAFMEIVPSESEKLHLFLIVDMIGIYEIKECKGQQEENR